jgi:DNA-nicking Smr family endonuclease
MGAKDIKLQALSELGPLLKRQKAQAAAREAAEKLARAQRLAEQARAQEFRHAVGAITPMKANNLAQPERPKPEPVPSQRLADERRALLQTWSDDVDVESLLLTDDGLSYRLPGVSLDVVTRLRRGQWAIQGEIDLHGLRTEEARDALALFLREQHQLGRRCLRVVHGKGLGSPGRQPILKGKVQKWLGQADRVMAFSQATPAQGGAGALIVLLQA